ncbi:MULTISPECIES: hypothetical protein [unclassified Candidatus Frackibacter]|uniref:hypothetical protein n=1 Tax=unclassified Candidatus Frackibacter TaxID=2648818 RepID=UPI00088FF32E|nr:MULTISPECIES: hypothetical protein [unclassified Candidatus Frackibacter]SDC80137.1 hypothetical protein SAMN04515661_1266 [Candidatus Frackibacter sp. WG11]SEM92639.1 hypothetical protein SAMN04488698_1266 [Candidatus Frackibacter sp. WG12]SFM03270.1 hypothetical protein SAMN04488699_12753 [Candidatus Frackibacter sp. WG13]
MSITSNISSKQIIIILIIILSISLLSITPIFAKEDSEVKNVIEHGNVMITKDQVVKNVIAVGGEVIIAGTVKDDVVVLGGDLVIKPSAIILGNIGVIGGKVTQASEAKITENIFNLELLTSDFDILLVGLLLLLFFMFIKYLVAIILLLLSILLNLLIPKQINSIADTVTNDFIKVALIGVTSLLLFNLLIIITAFTIIGSAFSLLLLSLLLAGIFIGLNGMAYLIGKQLSKLITIKIDSQITLSIFGMSLIALCWFIPIIGGLFLIVLATLGFGAIIYNLLPLK